MAMGHAIGRGPAPARKASRSEKALTVATYNPPHFAEPGGRFVIQCGGDDESVPDGRLRSQPSVVLRFVRGGQLPRGPPSLLPLLWFMAGCRGIFGWHRSLS